MIDYTPTTEEVRLDYAPAKTFPADAEEQFDRWLNEVKAQAWEEGAYHIAGSDNALVTKADNENSYRQGEEQ